VPADDKQYCRRHLKPTKCKKSPCSQLAVLGSITCIAHGGAPRCEHEGCMRFSVSTNPMCTAHAVMWPCEHPGCTQTTSATCVPPPRAACGRSSVSVRVAPKSCTPVRSVKWNPHAWLAWLLLTRSTKLCDDHSITPSPRCTAGDCTRFAIGGKPVCVAHSNLQSCKHPDCPRVAPVGRTLCEPHYNKVRVVWRCCCGLRREPCVCVWTRGTSCADTACVGSTQMGQKCDSKGCNRYTVAGRPKCVIHIGELKCEHEGCNLMPADDFDYCEDHIPGDTARKKAKRAKKKAKKAKAAEGSGVSDEDDLPAPKRAKRGKAAGGSDVSDEDDLFFAYKKTKRAKAAAGELSDEDHKPARKRTKAKADREPRRTEAATSKLCRERRCLEEARRGGYCKQHKSERKKALRKGRAAAERRQAGELCSVPGCVKGRHDGELMCPPHLAADAACMPPVARAVPTTAAHLQHDQHVLFLTTAAAWGLHVTTMSLREAERLEADAAAALDDDDAALFMKLLADAFRLQLTRSPPQVRARPSKRLARQLRSLWGAQGRSVA
jgi:hypothetical protein